MSIDTQSVLVIGGVLLLAQTGLRLWMLIPSWFYTDDYRFLSRAKDSRLTLDYLAEPFDSQYMPFGRAVAWWVANSGDAAVNWNAAVLATMITSTLCSMACLWMLITVFGARWEVLVLYAIYLFSAVSAPALMWWAAGLNQLPLQAVWFVSVATWVLYLRTRAVRWLAFTLLTLVAGLLCYVKALLLIPVLAFIALAYFASGSLGDRVRSVLRDFWPAAVGAALAAGAYLLYYAVAVPQPFIQGDTEGLVGDLADTMLGTSFVSSAVGGPWRWDTSNPPTGYADPPSWSVHIAWIAVLLLVALSTLLRRRAGRAWLLLGLSLAMAYSLVLTTRAPVAGAAIGYEMRYLTETICALVLACGLAWLPVPGAVESSSERDESLIRVRPTPLLVGVAASTYLVGAVFSNATYAWIWHTDNPGDGYLHAVADTANGQGGLELADGTVPADVMPGFSFPYNTLSSLMPLFTDKVSFPDASAKLNVVGPGGLVGPAELDVTTGSRAGPVEGCGWKVTSGSTRVPLSAETLDFDWWIRVGYLASQQSPLTVTVAGEPVETTVMSGLGTLYVRVSAGFDDVEFSGLAPGTTLCVDSVDVGVIAQESSP